jgi:hypothetical protein
VENPIPGAGGGTVVMAWQSAQHTLGAPLGYRSTLRQPWHTIWLCIPGAAAAAAGRRRDHRSVDHPPLACSEWWWWWLQGREAHQLRGDRPSTSNRAAAPLAGDDDEEEESRGGWGWGGGRRGGWFWIGFIWGETETTGGRKEMEQRGKGEEGGDDEGGRGK